MEKENIVRLYNKEKTVTIAKRLFILFQVLAMKFGKALILFLFVNLLAFQLFASARGIAVSLPDQNNKQVQLYTGSFALVIGVSNYTDWPRLPGVREDVAKVVSTLEKHHFTPVVIMDPNDKELKSAFTDFIKKYGMGLQNRLLFYYAGHGHTEKQSYGEEMGYIVPANAPVPQKDKNGFLNSALDMQLIEVYAKRIQSKHALFLFDSCFSGSIFALSRAIPQAINYKTTQPVRQFITSGSANETVPDKSIFREQFIGALEGEGDLNKDGYVTGSELGDFLETTVINYSREGQHPQYGKIRNRHLDKGDFVFVSPATPGSASASSTGTSGSTGTHVASGSMQTEAVGKGCLKVNSEPNQAEIYIDDLLSGTSPLQIRLKPGIYAVEARKRGYQTESKRIRIFEGADLDLTLMLDKKGSSLFITSQPSKAEVYIDRAYSGQTPLELKGLNPGGSMAIKVSKEGYQDWNRSVSIHDANQQLQATLKQKQTVPQDMVLIPAGDFEMGSNDEKPVHTVTLDAYYIDKTEVTVAAYRKCVTAGTCKTPATGSYYNWGVAGRETHPVNGVDWMDAKNYCQFAKKRLPTEAEWERAATWKDGRKYKYPSGKSTVSCVDAVMVNSDSWRDWKTKGGCDRISTWPVGSKPQEINGTYDMAGNVPEWVADGYGPYSSSHQRNPQGPSSGGSHRVNRGGGWIVTASSLRGALRLSYDPSGRSNGGLGFRCVGSP
ncbi:SUMF1/EgtB/PvdO family nonheme iron enzyme [bacterium]|nr:SUMF1/EgtB/PvdO family nonheme iron enzyme [bacterium]